jgi:heme/copper-type cytochrome/quinol oxidase subunit 2
MTQTSLEVQWQAQAERRRRIITFMLLVLVVFFLLLLGLWFWLTQPLFGSSFRQEFWVHFIHRPGITSVLLGD